MNYSNQEEIDAIAVEFINLRNKLKNSKSKSLQRKFEEYKNFCIEQFKFLVTNKLGKYRKFSNVNDLEQDGLEALVLALKTYNPDKGSFSWWADNYIKTRISRAANTHSTIRFPLKKARDLKPFKVSTIPIMVDTQPDAVESLVIIEQSEHVSKAIKKLPEQHQQLINLVYGFNGMKPHSIVNVVKALSISRPQCLKMLEEAKIKLKEELSGA